MADYYTYIWLRSKDGFAPAGTPYYVGKGRGVRGFTSNAHSIHCPKDRSRILFRYWDSEADAFHAEKMLIARYGRQDNGTGILRNMTDGGEGASGCNVSEATREKQSRRLAGKPKSPRHRAALAAHLLKVQPLWSQRTSEQQAKILTQLQAGAFAFNHDPIRRAVANEIVSKKAMGNHRPGGIGSQEYWTPKRRKEQSDRARTNFTKEQRRSIGLAGAAARWAKTTVEQRSEMGRKLRAIQLGAK